MKYLCLLLICGLSGRVAAAEPEPGLKLVPLHNGVNAVDVNSDGRDDLIVVAQRENGNAHGYEATALYIWAEGVLQAVPLHEPKGQPDVLFLKPGGGADGLLSDFRLFIDPAHHTAVIITAERRFGESFADTQPVEFEYFRLMHSEEGLAGEPLFWFQSYRKTTSKKPHLDVNEAFKAELDIELDGRHPMGPY